MGRLDLTLLLEKQIYTLSGGESVRVALASIAAQGVKELQIDTALEQLDERWRATIMTLLLTDQKSLSDHLLIADNRLTQDELNAFRDKQNFPLEPADNTRWTKVIDSNLAAELLPSSQAPTLSLRDVSFAYGRRSPLVFQNVSLTLEPGNIFILQGENGSGKTTFVKLLCGTLLPSQGQILWGTSPFEPGKSSKRYAGIAFQNPDFQWTSQTVSSELRRAQNTTVSNIGAAKALLAFGIPEGLLQSDPSDLPFAFKKRLGIALSVLFGKSWFIFDEPTLGQDANFRYSLVEFINVARQRGAGIILISHDTAFRSRFSKAKTLTVQGGKIVNNMN
jgi:energy-coupling factor transporter ATP-binding protein EcfA2